MGPIVIGVSRPLHWSLRADGVYPTGLSSPSRSPPRRCRSFGAAGAATAVVHPPVRRLPWRPGLGTSKAPALAMNQRVAEQSSEQLVTYLQHGNPAAGMPSFADLGADERATLARYLMRLNVETITKPVPPAGAAAPKTWVSAGQGRLAHLQRRDSGNRYSPLSRSPRKRVHAEAQVGVPASILRSRDHAAGCRRHAVCDRPNQVFALDALTGAALWTTHGRRAPGCWGMRGSAPTAGSHSRRQRVS